LAVRLGGPPAEVVDSALQGTVVVAVAGCVVVVLAEVVVEVLVEEVVVVVGLVVVVVLLAGCPTKRMFWVALSPNTSPKAIRQESPAAICAVVGGHG
jgi:hypothetical protein